MSASSENKDYAGNNNGSFFMKFLLGMILFVLLVGYILGQNYDTLPVVK